MQIYEELARRSGPLHLDAINLVNERQAEDAIQFGRRLSSGPKNRSGKPSRPSRSP